AWQKEPQFALSIRGSTMKCGFPDRYRLLSMRAWGCSCICRGTWMFSSTGSENSKRNRASSPQRPLGILNSDSADDLTAALRFDGKPSISTQAARMHLQTRSGLSVQARAPEENNAGPPPLAARLWLEMKANRIEDPVAKLKYLRNGGAR